MKKLLLTTRCVTDYANGSSGFPQSFYIELTSEDIHKINTFRGALGQVNAQSICGFFRGGCWSSSFIEYSDVVCDLQGVVSRLHQEKVDVELPKLNITKGHFYFSAIPKGCSEGLEIRTEEVSFSELESNETFADVD